MSMIQSYIHSSDFRLILTSSTSKTNTEFPGIFGGEPLAPYPISGGITNLRFSPSHILKLKNEFNQLSLKGVIKKCTRYLYNINETTYPRRP